MLKYYLSIIILLLLILNINAYHLEKYKNEWIGISEQSSAVTEKIVLAKDEFMKFRIVRGPLDYERVNISITSDGMNENIIFYSHPKQEVATKENCEGEKRLTGFSLSRCISNAYYFSIQMDNKWLSGDIIFKIVGEEGVRCH